jgi:hypothetical protein
MNVLKDSLTNWSLSWSITRLNKWKNAKHLFHLQTIKENFENNLKSDYLILLKVNLEKYKK